MKQWDIQRHVTVCSLANWSLSSRLRKLLWLQQSTSDGLNDRCSSQLRRADKKLQSQFILHAFCVFIVCSSFQRRSAEIPGDPSCKMVIFTIGLLSDFDPWMNRWLPDDVVFVNELPHTGMSFVFAHLRALLFSNWQTVEDEAPRAVQGIQTADRFKRRTSLQTLTLHLYSNNPAVSNVHKSARVRWRILIMMLAIFNSSCCRSRVACAGFHVLCHFISKNECSTSFWLSCRLNARQQISTKKYASSTLDAELVPCTFVDWTRIAVLVTHEYEFALCDSCSPARSRSQRKRKFDMQFDDAWIQGWNSNYRY